MSLFQRPIQPPAILSDEAVARYLRTVRAELTVDPLFRRRLRGQVVNRFVADREGRAPASTRRRMGALGRAVLYASFALSVSVTSAMAAAQGAVPGDALYPLKLQIERLRLEALPERLQDDLAAHSLGERIHELGVLAERGEWERVTAQAAAVELEYRRFVDSARVDGSSDRYLLVLTGLLQRLPERAQLAIEDVLDGVEGAIGEGSASVGNRGPGAASSDDGRVNGDSGPDDPAGPDAQTPEPTAEPDKEPKPDPTPRASKSPRPSGDPATRSDASESHAPDE